MGPKAECDAGASPKLQPGPADSAVRALPVWEPPADVLVVDETVVVRLELAGTAAEAIHVHAAATEVIVAGIRRDPMGVAPRRIDRMEIAFGPFERTVPLPCSVDPDRARAHLADGLLEIALPLAGASYSQTLVFFEIRVSWG
ncbi:MAG TPA: Hsp20/alpha crystallin family protein [Isosphaeraceae bacterium]|jgi:HSP20 family protein|nr:Hsp20/alpha crystallin family protein [Isosphaeraceae bacterium]